MATSRTRRTGDAARCGRAALGVLAPVLLIALAISGGARAADSVLGAFHGTFVGTAATVPATDSAAKPRLRDIDIVIEPYKTGFRITWITVFRVDGKRVDPGVRRRTTVQTFLPQDGATGIYRQAAEIDMFRGRRDPDLLAGDTVRWARLDGRTLSVYSLGLDDRGRYQLQTYHRRLTSLGLDLEFTRLRDGVVDLRIAGEAARVRD